LLDAEKDLVMVRVEVGIDMPNTAQKNVPNWQSVVYELKSENINGSVNETRSTPLTEYYTNLPSALGLVRRNDRFVKPAIKIGQVL
jgi:hypothetical protein